VGAGAGAAVLEHEVPREPEPTRRSRRGLVIVLVVVLVVGSTTAAAADAWYRGGTFLSANGAGVGSFRPTGSIDSFGVDLTTSGGPSVVLDRAWATPPAGAKLDFSIYRAPPGGLGFGTWQGPLAPQWKTHPVHGYRVAQASGHPERGGTWLVATLTAIPPGVYALDDITIRYHSGSRTRTTKAVATMCLLTYPNGQRTRVSQQIDSFERDITSVADVDPLVAQYETCLDPTLQG
jgi:hypothetical protein